VTIERYLDVLHDLEAEIATTADDLARNIVEKLLAALRSVDVAVAEYEHEAAADRAHRAAQAAAVAASTGRQS
jgi:hypothetical protein